MKSFAPKLAYAFFCQVLLLTLAFVSPASAQDASAKSKQLYDHVKGFSLGGGSIAVSGLAFNRDRVQMTLTGTIYFSTPCRWPLHRSGVCR